jgi:polar amino acid transport system substrate-binding protein
MYDALVCEERGKVMRKFLVVATLLALLVGSACAEEGQTPAAGSDGGPKCDVSNPPLFQEGQLTVGVDLPGFAPWFGKPLESNKGFEGALVGEIAKRMGGLDVKYVNEPFNKSYSPGAKDYDFSIQEITITPEREQAVDFSQPYYDNNQAVLALEGTPITSVQNVKDLANYELGAQVGTTSLDFITSVVQPEERPKIFDSTNDGKSALESGQIDGFVTDVVTTVYLRDFEIKGSTVVGQYPEEEHFGMLFEEGNPLRLCVNEVLAEIKDDGTLEKLEQRWLQQYLKVPTLS